jgi:hypothetical protein
MTRLRCQLACADESPCDRPAVVRIEDRAGDAANGCDRHGARALRAIAGARVHPLPGHDGAAIAVYLTARGEGRP